MSVPVTTPSKMLSLYNRPEEAQILAVDIRKPLSFVKVLKMEEECGKIKWIPRHLIGYDNNWRYIFKKVRWFLSSNKNVQKMEIERWNKFQFWEKGIYNRRIGELLEQREQIRERMAAYSSAKPDTIPQQNSQRAEVVTPQVVDRSSNKQNNNNYIDYECEAISRSRDHFKKDVKRTKRKRNNNNQTEYDSEEAETNDNGEADNGLKSVSLFDAGEERQALVDQGDSLKKKKKDPHTSGTNATTVTQQADSIALETLHRAMEKVATAIDTCHFKDRVDKDPRLRILLLVMNDFSPSSVDGGLRNLEDLKAEKPLLIALTDRSKDIKIMLRALYQTTRMANIDENDRSIKFIPLVCNENGSVSDVVQEYINCYKKSRKNPSQTARSYSDIINEV